jgi:predicted MFS family arabinose efflux permease
MLALVALPFSNHPLPFLLAIGLVGILSVAVQILVPFAAHLAPEARRGQVVGNVMSGLMMGIMLARPVSSFVTQISSWQTVLPQRHPRTQSSYAGLLLSMVHLLGHTPVLQRRAFYHACMFGAFSLFWTVTPLLLARSPYLFSQGEIALFAFVGVAGAIAAPIAGRVADKGWTWLASIAAMGIASLAFLSTWLFHQPTPFVVALCIAGVMIDFGVTANLVLGQRALFILAPEHRARLNGLYMAIFFLGGAAGSALGAWTYAQGGWIWASTLGAALPAVAFLVCLTEKRT